MNKLQTVLERVLKQGEQILTDQEKLDADVAALGAGLDAVEAEIAELKAQPAAAALDFTALDAAVARVQNDAPVTPPTQDIGSV
jgi:hypothetical protein